MLWQQSVSYWYLNLDYYENDDEVDDDDGGNDNNFNADFADIAQTYKNALNLIFILIINYSLIFFLKRFCNDFFR